MSKRTVFTTVTPLAAGISRETVMATLHDHLEMIDLNNLVQERHPIKPPSSATPEEYHCAWYSLTDKVTYLPGGIMTGKVTYNACFHNLANGVQTHCYAPMGLHIKGKWTLGGSLPGEPIAPVEIGLGTPLHGLWLREDVDMKCNIMMAGFVKKTMKKSHATLVQRIMVRAQLISASMENTTLSGTPSMMSEVSLDRQSTSYSQYSSRDSQSIFDNQSILEDPISAFPPHTALSPRPSRGFRYEDQQSSRDGRSPFQDSKALSIRSSSSSITGSHSTGQTSHQGSTNRPNAGSRAHRSQLNVHRTSSTNEEFHYQIANAPSRNSQISQDPHTYQKSAQRTHSMDRDPSYQMPNSQIRSSKNSQDTPPYQSSAHHFQQPSEQHPAFRDSQQYGPHNDPVIQGSQPYSTHEQHHLPPKDSQPYPEYQQRHFPNRNTQPFPPADHIVDLSQRKDLLGQPIQGQQSQHRRPPPRRLELE